MRQRPRRDATGFEMLGRGAFGTVYRARTVDTHRFVALKVFDATRPSPDWAVRFVLECDRLRSLSERSQIVTVLEGGVLPDGAPYLVSELMPGGSLSSRLERGDRIAHGEVLAIALELAAALQSAHAVGVVHRAVKPTNVLMSRFGRPELADFVPALLSDDFERAARRSLSDAAFVAPEIRNGGSSSPSTDIYGLAATVTAMLTGGIDFSTTAMAASDASEELQTVLQKALSDTSRARFASMEEFRAALAAVPEAHTIWRWVRVPTPRLDPHAARLSSATTAGALTTDPAASSELDAEFAATDDPADGPPGFVLGPRWAYPWWWRRALGVLAVAVVALAATGAYKEMNSSSAASPPPAHANVVTVSVPEVAPPVAPTLLSTCLGYTCQFHAQGGTLPTKARLHWDFGDGRVHTARSDSVSHTYAKPGRYVVVVTENDRGTTGLSSHLPVTLTAWSRTARLSARHRGSLRVTLVVSSSRPACRAARFVVQRDTKGSWVTDATGTLAATGRRSFFVPHFGTYRAVVSENSAANGECGSGTTGLVTLRHRAAPPTIDLPVSPTPDPPAPRPDPAPAPHPHPSPTPTPTRKVVPTPTFGPPP